MHLKKYTIASLIFISLVGWYIFAYITQETMSINIFGLELPSLSIAIWVVVPLVAFYLVSIFHISFYSMLSSLRLRKYEKDYEKLVDSIAEAYLGKESKKHSFKTDRYSFLGSLLENSRLFPTDSLKGNTQSDKINDVVNIINDIKEGVVVDLKKYSLSVDNDIVVQNDRNKYKSGKISAEDVLNNSAKYADSLSQEIYADYVETAPLKTIEKYKKFLTKEALLKILSRINISDSNNMEITNDELLALFDQVELEKEDFMEITSVLSKGMLPEQRMKLFEILGDSNEKALDAYMFTLLDLEMLSLADEILNNSQATEYLNFKAYRALKDSNQNFSLNLFT